MTRVLLLLLCLFCSIKHLHSQGVFVNYDINSSSPELKAPLDLWLTFLACDDDAEGATYWSTVEVEKYGPESYFLIEHELDFGTSNYLGLVKYANLTVLRIQKIEERYKITSELAFQGQDGKANVQYIFHVYVQQENNELRIFNPLEINRELHMQSETVGFIRFNFPLSHTFNRALAEKQALFLREIAVLFDVPLVPVDYYFAPTTQEINAIRGFDFIVGSSGEEIPSGKADPDRGIVYGNGLGEYYPHEFMHILLTPHYPKCHLWIDEGVATFYGMSRGKPLDWHLNRLADYLETHPELNLNNLLSLRTMDAYTDFRYVLGGWLVQKTLEKGGVNLLKTLMESGTSDEALYSAIATHLAIPRDQLDQIIRAELRP